MTDATEDAHEILDRHAPGSPRRRARARGRGQVDAAAGARAGAGLGEGPGLRPAARAPVGREGGGRPARQRRAAPRLLGQLRLGRGPPDHEPPLRGRHPAGALDAAGQPLARRLPRAHPGRREEGGRLPHPGAARLPRRDAGGARRGARRRRRPRALQGGRGEAEGPRGGVREEARHPLPVRGVRRGALLHPHRVRGDQGRPARLRAAPRGRQLRRARPTTGAGRATPATSRSCGRTRTARPTGPATSSPSRRRACARATRWRCSATRGARTARGSRTR